MRVLFGFRALICNPRRPIMQILFLILPYGYVTIRIKRIPKEIAVLGSTDAFGVDLQSCDEGAHWYPRALQTGSDQGL